MLERPEKYRCRKDCPERRKGCHGGCERYAKYKGAWARVHEVQKPYRTMATFSAEQKKTQ